MKYSQVEAVVRDLREMADFIEKYGVELPKPVYGLDRIDFKIHTLDREAMVKAARILHNGTSVTNPLKKSMNDWSYDLRRKFGDNCLLEVWSTRDAVCDRREVGTKQVPIQVSVATGETREEKIYEYDCHPLLAT